MWEKIKKGWEECDRMKIEWDKAVDPEKWEEFGSVRELVAGRWCEGCAKFFKCKIMNALEKKDRKRWA
ncbi:MAG: hypothetical protein ACD_2C00119G0010 [uncultured bacterium (gcode 4)]|uniref:Uncharacterized protein n=1 Tax=uncultured bacterium (gcode 4) TaxID=1234023 RepID=K2GH17_9BACT|nr:MAG: hypothetical protein ACD_2C00119G0010 [uncultured bacterium (gcode 4)]